MTKVTVGTRRVEHTLTWLRALCSFGVGLSTRLPLAPTALGVTWRIVTDASPWGGGAVLYHDGRAIEWLSTDWGRTETEQLGADVGSHKWQATYEALAVLVAVRAFSGSWGEEFLDLGIGSDSMATLGALEKGRSSSPGMNRIVREITLDEALSTNGFALVLRHLPAKENLLADALSRLGEPGSGAVVPPELAQLPRRAAEDRGPAWWRAGGRAESVVAEEGAEEAPRSRVPEDSLPPRA